ncbi:hypothetical protein AKO1_013070 [Acrasis kona]|uniref:Uncharacterized protein n=1 Tax=Acrasis kona TaxID=1008807 RepID=A0AAW2YZ79_9EUKA
MKVLFLCLSSIVLLLSYYRDSIESTIRLSGLFKTIKQFNTHNCTIKYPKELQACEDFQVINSGASPQILFGCSTNMMQRYVWFPPFGALDKSTPGIIRDSFYLYDVNSDQLTTLSLEGFPESNDLVLHGFAATKIDDDNHALYVINHRRQGNGDLIEKFIYKTGGVSLRHVESFDGSDNGIVRTANAITVIDHKTDSFYVTNDHFYQTSPMHDLELVLIRPWSFVSFYSKETGFKIVKEGLHSACGINHVGDKVLVTAVQAGAMYVYDVNQDHTLKLFKKIDFDFLVDNIQISDGLIYVAGHPSALDFVKYVKNPRRYTAPSMVARVPVDEALSATARPIPEIVFSDPGALISGSSVGTILKVGDSNIQFVSGVINEGFLRCDQ